MKNPKEPNLERMDSMAKVLSMAMATPKPLGMAGILRESLQLPTRNLKLMISNTLLMLILFLALATSHNLIAGPFLMEIEDLEPGNSLAPKFQKHIRILFVLESVFLLIFFIHSLFAMSMTIHASAATYTGEYLHLKDVFSRTVATWKRPTITCFYVVLLITFTALLAALLFSAFVLIFNGAALIAFISLMGILAMLFYLYLAVVWILGLVISIVEEDCYGITALIKAGVLIKGRKLQGCALMLFLVLLTAPLSALFSLNIVEDEIRPVSRVAIGIMDAVLVCLVKLFGFVVYTVFYYQCRSNGEKEDMEEGTRDRLVSIDLIHVNDSLS